MGGGTKMPWLDKERRTGCTICVAECPVGSISIEDEKAEINMQTCIRCGLCHEVCPEEAVRHDSEKVPENIKPNVEKTKKFMELCVKYLGNVKEADKCLDRMIKHFRKDKMIAEKTLEELEKLRNKAS
jgi:ferredoxin